MSQKKKTGSAQDLIDELLFQKTIEPEQAKRLRRELLSTATGTWIRDLFGVVHSALRDPRIRDELYTVGMMLFQVAIDKAGIDKQKDPKDPLWAAFEDAMAEEEEREDGEDGAPDPVDWQNPDSIMRAFTRWMKRDVPHEKSYEKEREGWHEGYEEAQREKKGALLYTLTPGETPEGEEGLVVSFNVELTAHNAEDVLTDAYTYCSTLRRSLTGQKVYMRVKYPGTNVLVPMDEDALDNINAHVDFLEGTREDPA